LKPLTGKDDMNRRSPLALTAALVLSSALPFASSAADYPAKPITFIVPWPAGGTTDIIGRLLAESMSADMGTPGAYKKAS
jgi:tripartite-type tricarboxylate transporter receptor subunit TctC